MDLELKSISPIIASDKQVVHRNALTSQQHSAHKNLKEVSEEFEASFIAEMLKFAKVVKPREGIGGGGHGEKTFSSFLITEYAKEMSEHHNLGLAEKIYANLKDRVNHGE